MKNNVYLCVCFFFFFFFLFFFVSKGNLLDFSFTVYIAYIRPILGRKSLLRETTEKKVLVHKQKDKCFLIRYGQLERHVFVSK